MTDLDINEVYKLVCDVDKRLKVLEHLASLQVKKADNIKEFNYEKASDVNDLMTTVCKTLQSVATDQPKPEEVLAPGEEVKFTTADFLEPNQEHVLLALTKVINYALGIKSVNYNGPPTYKAADAVMSVISNTLVPEIKELDKRVLELCDGTQSLRTERDNAAAALKVAVEKHTKELEQASKDNQSLLNTINEMSRCVVIDHNGKVLFASAEVCDFVRYQNNQIAILKTGAAFDADKEHT